jgi:hypothetical protein
VNPPHRTETLLNKLVVVAWTNFILSCSVRMSAALVYLIMSELLIMWIEADRLTALED